MMQWCTRINDRCVYPAWSPLGVKKRQTELKEKERNLTSRTSTRGIALHLRFRFNCDYSEASPWPAWRNTRCVEPGRAERSALAVSHRAGGRYNKSPHTVPRLKRARLKRAKYECTGRIPPSAANPLFFATAATMRRSAVHSVAFSSSLILFECVYIRAAAGFGHATRAKRVRPSDAAYCWLAWISRARVEEIRDKET